MGGKGIAVLLLAGTLGGLVPFAPIPYAAAHGGGDDVITAGRTVQGEVTQKFTLGSSTPLYMIAVEGQPYAVPPDIYERASVGTIVQFDGKHWTIISNGI